MRSIPFPPIDGNEVFLSPSLDTFPVTPSNRHVRHTRGVRQLACEAAPSGGAAGTAKRRLVATYDYTDENGKLLFQVQRFSDKTFPQRRPFRDGWAWSLSAGHYRRQAGNDWRLLDTKKETPGPKDVEADECRRVLYHLPKLLKADQATVYLVEGEKDVETLESIDLLSTTNPGGAGKWRDEYAEVLRGRDIVIFPDNDKAGREHAEKVTKALQGVAASVLVVELPGVKEKGDVSDWLIMPGNNKEKLLALVNEEMLRKEDAIHDAAKAGQQQRSKSDGNKSARPKIIITTNEHRVNAKAVRALAGDPGVYQRGGMLVRVVRDDSPAAKGVRRPLAPRIEALPLALLRERLAASARWITVHQTKKKRVELPAHPPAWSVAAVHARADWPAVRHLEAVVDYPVLRPDGTILDRPGYDFQTGLLLDTSAFPLIPDRPAKEEAVAACLRLLEVVADFPFESDAHRAAWLAALLTPLARFAFTGPAPLFLADANVRSAGKGLLLDCISWIITGQRFTIATYTDDEDELRKRITALAMAGDRLVLFDNLVGQFGNGTLDAALTGTAWEDRVLGGNRMYKGPLYMTWYATGNNVLIGADTARRTCHIRLESPEERPEERQGFRHPNLLAWVAENRTQLLADALTILRGYCAAGRPAQNLPAWGSFEGWSALVRAAVVWVGQPDPGETRLILQKSSDVAAENMGVILACWKQMDPGQQGLTAAEVIHQLYKDPPESPTDWHADMKDALEALLGKPDSRGLGNRLRTYRRRVFQGLFLDQCGTLMRAARWAVYPAQDFGRRLEKTHKTHKTHTQGEPGGPEGRPAAGENPPAPPGGSGVSESCESCESFPAGSAAGENPPAPPGGSGVADSHTVFPESL